MAFLRVNEQDPESSEYVSNYIYFDENEPGALKKMIKTYISDPKKKKSKGYQLIDSSDIRKIQSTFCTSF